jgi:hypothetical protein
MEAIRSSETSVLKRATWCHLPEDDNHHSHRRGNLKSYKATDKFNKLQQMPLKILCTASQSAQFPILHILHHFCRKVYENTITNVTTLFLGISF